MLTGFSLEKKDYRKSENTSELTDGICINSKHDSIVQFRRDFKDEANLKTISCS